MKYIFQTLKNDKAINFYEKIDKFQDPINFKINLNVEREYSASIMKFLEKELQQRNMRFGSPKLNIKKISSSSSSFLKNNKNMVSLLDFMK